MQMIDTQAISIRAPREVVLDLVGDPTQLPRWAPAFARTVRPAGEDWIVEAGEGALRIRVRVSRDHGTVDFLAAGLPDGVEVGAFSRVISDGAGSAYMFTRFLPHDMSPEDVARARAVVAEELETVRDLCER